MAPRSEVAIVPVLKSVTRWDKNGLPMAGAVPTLTQQSIRECYLAAAAQPFVVEDPFDPDFGKYEGMTIAEVLIRKSFEHALSSGDLSRIEIVMDRLIGKSVAHSESKNLVATTNIEAWLKERAAAVSGREASEDWELF